MQLQHFQNANAKHNRKESFTNKSHNHAQHAQKKESSCPKDAHFFLENKQ
jgi:hypothetical protein